MMLIDTAELMSVADVLPIDLKIQLGADFLRCQKLTILEPA
jgi:hypothetical protein